MDSTSEHQALDKAVHRIIKDLESNYVPLLDNKIQFGDPIIYLLFQGDKVVFAGIWEHIKGINLARCKKYIEFDSFLLSPSKVEELEETYSSIISWSEPIYNCVFHYNPRTEW